MTHILNIFIIFIAIILLLSNDLISKIIKLKAKPFWTKFWVNVQQSEPEMKKIVLVFYLGGGHFDVSLISIDNANGENRVLSTHGDNNLGSEDFNHRVVDYFVERYQKNTGRDIRQNNKAIQKLRIKVEEAKKALSDRNEVEIIESLFVNDDFAENLTRDKFEELNEDLFMRTLESIEKVIDDAKLSKNDVDKILLVGGSSRIPRIQQLLKDFFQGKKLYPINDEAVISGITVQTSNFNEGENIPAAIDLQDVTPLSIGIQHGNGWMNTIIRRNTVIPTESYISTGTMRHYQTNVIITIYEGESNKTKDNHLLGEFELTGIRSAPAGEVVIGITLKLDCNGILHVSAIEEGSDNEGQITIAYDHRRRSPQDIEKMITDLKKYTADEHQARNNQQISYNQSTKSKKNIVWLKNKTKGDFFLMKIVKDDIDTADGKKVLQRTKSNYN